MKDRLMKRNALLKLEVKFMAVITA